MIARAEHNVTLQPPFRPRDSCRFHSIVCAQLADSFGKIIANRPLGKRELGRNVTAAQTFASQNEARAARDQSGDPVLPRPSVASSGSMTRRPCCTRRTASSEFFRAHIFQQVTRNPSFQCPSQITCTCECGEDNHAGSGTPAFQFAGHVESSHFRHFQCR